MKTLPSGVTGFYNDKNEFQVTGSAMGRKSWRDNFREHQADPIKCCLRRLRWVDGDYDEQGAYWGHVSGTWIYWANFDIGDDNQDIFVRATSRDDAKDQIRKELPQAKFFD